MNALIKSMSCAILVLTGTLYGAEEKQHVPQPVQELVNTAPTLARVLTRLPNKLLQQHIAQSLTSETPEEVLKQHDAVARRILNATDSTETQLQDLKALMAGIKESCTKKNQQEIAESQRAQQERIEAKQKNASRERRVCIGSTIGTCSLFIIMPLLMSQMPCPAHHP